jgi:hypothetical protein
MEVVEKYFQENHLRVWSELEEAWTEYAEENKFGFVYSHKMTSQDNSNDTPANMDHQNEEVPANHFSVKDDENLESDCP